MSFRYEGIEVDVATAARDLLDGLWDEEARAARRVDDPLPDAWAAACEAGWFDLLVDEEHGGLGLGVVVAGAVLEQVGSHLLPGPIVDGVASAAILRPAGIDSAGVSAVAMATGDAPKLVDGRLTTDAAAEWGDVADLLVIEVMGTEDPGLAVFDPRADGVAVSTTGTLDRFRRPCTVTFSNAVPIAVLEDQEQRRAQDLRSHRLALTAAECLGIAERVLDMSVAYAVTREQFGTAISSFQAVRHRLADMAVHVASIRSACHLALVALRDDAPDKDTLAAVAKAHAARSTREVVESGLQVHGGVGFTAEHELSGYFLRALSLQSAVADDAALRRELAHSALRQARS
jgi:alkylation response protein AidB-like acyl-CoA dehydrogenase